MVAGGAPPQDQPPSDRDVQQAKLIELLAGIDFSRRYYGYYERAKGRPRVPAPRPETLKAALDATGLSFKYNARERFFGHRERDDRCELVLNAALAGSAVEFILAVKTKNGYVGDPYAALAAAVERRRRPDFEYSPPYPKLPFSDEAELREVVGFGVELFQDAKQAILAHDGWAT